MQAPIGSNGWYLCNWRDDPTDDFVQFVGHDSHAVQFLNQFRGDVFVLRTFKGLLGATHPWSDDDQVFQDTALQVARDLWKVRRPALEMFPIGSS
jgi:hypothetical protein